MNDAEIRRRLHAALGESTYPPDLPARAAARLGEPVENVRAAWMLAVVAAALAIALVATIVLGSNALRHRASVPIVPPPNHVPAAAACSTFSQLNQQTPGIEMASPATGWADGGLRTTDGGATWRDTSPNALRSGMPQPAMSNGLYPPGFKFFGLDANHAWEFRTYSSSTTCIDHGQVYATADGGRTWRQSQPISFRLPAGWGGAAADFQFVDASHGWIWIQAGPWQVTPGWGTGAIPDEALLYGTRDGGFSWRVLATLKPQDFGLASSKSCTFGLGEAEFASPEKGWITVGCGGQTPVLLASADGGSTWKAQTVDVPLSILCPCSTQLEHVFDASHLIVTVQGGSSGGTYATADGGETWRPVPSPPNAPNVLAVDYVDLGDWWAVVTEPGWQKGMPTNDWLYRTTDGGLEWTLVQTGLPLGYPVEELDFIDAEHGLAAQAQGASTGPPIGPGEEILVTGDGGHTWHAVTEQFGQPG